VFVPRNHFKPSPIFTFMAEILLPFLGNASLNLKHKTWLKILTLNIYSHIYIVIYSKCFQHSVIKQGIILVPHSGSIQPNLKILDKAEMLVLNNNHAKILYKFISDWEKSFIELMPVFISVQSQLA
jgi:hypothetical protein